MPFLFKDMLRCLNPKKSHENRVSRPVSSGKTVALPAPASAEASEEQVACQYCKYLLAGAVLGDCRAIRWIGSGAFGDVYEAEQLPPLSRRVAIKVMAIERVVDGESAEMFAREVSTIAALDHPNILPVLRVGMIDDGRSYLVMKYAAQGSLQQFCQLATPTFPPSSLVPTMKHTNIAETPTDELAIVSAETLRIAETFENTASSGNTSDAPGVQQSPAIPREISESQKFNAEARTPTSAPIAPEEFVTVDHALDRASETPQSSRLSTADEAVREAIDSPDEAADRVQTPVTTKLDAPDDSETSHDEQATTPLGLDSTTQHDEQATIPLGLDSADDDEVLQGEQAPGAVIEALVEANEVEVVDNTHTLAVSPDAERTLKARREPFEDMRDGEARASSTSLRPAEEQQGGAPGQDIEQISTLMLADNARPALTPPGQPLLAGRRVLPLSLQQVQGYLEEAASALAYAHQRGLIHLDVKPANLLLDAEGRLMLADFGVSVLLEGYTHASLHYYVGTPLYTAPEQWLEQPRTASDQYALAVTCYQLLTGRPPFTGNLYAVMHGHLQAAPPPMYELNPLIPAQIEAVLQRALAKDPTDRYSDILAFASAFHEAIEAAASADTDTQMQQRAALLLKEHTPPLPTLDKSALLPVATDEGEDEQTTSKKLLPDTLSGSKTDWELPGNLGPQRRGHWLRNLLLCVLALLLIAGGSLGFVRSQRPCWLGICPQIMLNTNAVTLTNSELQLIEITNAGTDTLHWQASLHPLASWLSLNITSGTLAPKHASKLMLRTSVDLLNQNGVYTAMLAIYGGPGVATQTVEVTENVVKGLGAISVNTSGQTFLYEENKSQPSKQKITISNQSGHTLNWFTQYTDNNWLSVTPSEGSLKNAASVDLTATVENPQNLANDIYQVRFSLVGQLDNQSNPTLLQTINFTLQVNQKPSVQASPTTASASPTAVPNSPLAFTAQPIAGSGAPTVQRSNHSMVWDTQDDQLLIFGGSDAQGNLLNDLWSYNPANNQWANLTEASASSNDCSGNAPSPRKDAAMVWDSKDHEILLYGGIGRANSYLGDLWTYSPARGTWSVLTCTGNAPGTRGEAGVAWNGSQMLLLGGRSASGILTDFWSYTPGSGNGWSQVAATTPLGARAYPAMSWDTHDKQLDVFGGLSGNGQQLGDFYSYQPNSGWSTIVPNGAAPLARQQALSTWDSKDKVFLLMDGWQASNSSTYSTLWAYSPSNNAWWQITSFHENGSTSVIPSRMASVMVWDPDDNRAYIYAGSSGTAKTALNDLWTITPA